MQLNENFKNRLLARLETLHSRGAGTIGDMLDLQLVDCDLEKGEFTMQCRTQEWMRNIAGTLHGGMCATLVDQSMGCVAYCAMPGEGIAPTIDLQVSYHRPLIPGEDVLIRVKVVSVTKSLMYLSSEACQVSRPDRICITSTATFFYKPMPIV